MPNQPKDQQNTADGGQEDSASATDQGLAGDNLVHRRKKLSEAEMRKRFSFHERWAKIFSFSPSMEMYQALELLIEGAELVSVEGERPFVRLGDSSCYLPSKHARYLIKHDIIKPDEYKNTVRKGIDRRMTIYSLNEQSIYDELYESHKHNYEISQAVINQFKGRMSDILKKRRHKSAHKKAKRTKMINNPEKLHPSSKHLID